MQQAKNHALDYFLSFVIVGICTVISVPLRSRLELTNFAMFYLFGVIVVSVRLCRGAAILSAFLSVTAFYYFCVPFHDSFVLEDYSYVIPLLAMLAVALVISNLTVRIRSQAAHAMEKEVEIQAERMRSSLLSAVSHNVKTPIASIYGAATSLLEEEERLDKFDRRELVESIAKEAERLNKVVTNLLEMTRLDAGVQIRKDWHPLEEIVGAALTRLENPLGDRPVKIEIPSELPLIYVDDALLEEVFVNILENALKYTPPGTPLEISASENGQNVSISVQDGGPGFQPGDEERVFEKFFRGKTDGVRGVGLGLPICRAIVSHSCPN